MNSTVDMTPAEAIQCSRARGGEPVLLHDLDGSVSAQFVRNCDSTDISTPGQATFVRYNQDWRPDWSVTVVDS